MVTNDAYRFCRDCGTPTIVIDSDSYDTQTGERHQRRVCDNRKCRPGCFDRHGGHDYRGWFLDRCRYCGARPVYM